MLKNNITQNNALNFIQKANLIHKNIFDYGEVNYVNHKISVNIICKIHGMFNQTPHSHLNGHGCYKCSGIIRTNEEKVKKANITHNSKYDYSKVDFNLIKRKQKVIIICPIHGEFKQSWYVHQNTSGCPNCGKLQSSKRKLLKINKFIEKAKIIHSNKYDYSKVNYIGAHKKVTIICSKHGEFLCTPVNHWSNKVGCPKCIPLNPSRAELYISNWLDKHNIIYECEKTFPNLVYKSKKGKLKYDFWLPNFNLLIEYDGEHHFEPMTWSKKINGIERLTEQRKRDEIKSKYAVDNNIQLLRIKFNDDIDLKLSSNLIQNLFLGILY